MREHIFIDQVFSPSERDLGIFVPNLAVDVAEIMATGVVPDTGTNNPYSKETEISQVGHYLTDKIQTEIASHRLGRQMNLVSESDKKDK